MSKKVQKHIGFSREVIEVGKKKAKRIGMSFPEYVRFLVLRDIKDELELPELRLDERETLSYITGIKDFRADNSFGPFGVKDAIEFLDQTANESE